MVSGTPGFGGEVSDGRRAGGVRIGDIGIRGKTEGGDGVSSLGSSQIHGGRHDGSRLPLMGGVHVCCAMLEAPDRSSGTIIRLAWRKRGSWRSDTIIGSDGVNPA